MKNIFCDTAGSGVTWWSSVVDFFTISLPNFFLNYTENWKWFILIAVIIIAIITTICIIIKFKRKKKINHLAIYRAISELKGEVNELANDESTHTASKPITLDDSKVQTIYQNTQALTTEILTLTAEPKIEASQQLKQAETKIEASQQPKQAETKIESSQEPSTTSKSKIKVVFKSKNSAKSKKPTTKASPKSTPKQPTTQEEPQIILSKERADEILEGVGDMLKDLLS